MFGKKEKRTTEQVIAEIESKAGPWKEYPHVVDGKQYEAAAYSVDDGILTLLAVENYAGMAPYIGPVLMKRETAKYVFAAGAWTHLEIKR